MTVGSGSALVGRSAELVAVDAALDAVANGRVAGLTLIGDAGMGKSRLLAELGARADRRGMLVLSGSASEFERDLPFWLFVDALDEYLRGLPPRRLDELGEDARAELANVLPSWPAATQESRGEEDRRYRTHRAVRRLLEVVAGTPPLVLLLDDLHWADSGSVELLCALLRRPPAAPVLLGLALRPRQVAGRLAGGLERAVADGLLARIELAGLTLDESRRLLGATVDDGLVPTLHQESGGNPFYLRQLAQFRRDDGAASTDAPFDAGVPARVAAALGDELALLDGATRRALEGAAVAGDPFLLDLAAAAAALPEAALADALDEFQRRDLVRPTGVPRRFRFRHPLLRRAIYESTPAAWRVGAHERCAEALAARGVPVAGRAHHVIASAREGDLTAAALLRDAGRAVIRRSPAEAARWFSAAVALLPEGARTEALDLWTVLAEARGAAGMIADAREATLRALDLVPADADAVRVRLTTTCAGLEQILGHHDDAHRRLVTALGSLPKLDSPEAVALMSSLAEDRLYHTEFEAAHEWSQRACTAAGQRGPLVEAVTVMALTAALSGATGDATAAVEEAAALVDGMADEEIASSPDPVIARLAGAELFIDRYADAARHAERGLVAAQALGTAHHHPVLFWTGIVRTALGRLPQATALLDDAVEAARSSGNPAMLGWTLLARSLAATARGETDAALTAAQESVDVLGGPAQTVSSAWAGLALGAALLPAGDPAAAEQALADSAGLALTRLPHPLRPSGFELLNRCRLALGDLDGAAAAADAIVDTSASATAAAGRARAAVALHHGDPRATEHALAAAHAAEAVGAPVEAAAARELAGRALADTGAVERAITELQRAAAGFERCGAPRRAAAVERRLRGLGHRRLHHRTPPGTGNTGVASLTGRELEIARLIADRRTNTEIASTLFLSGKTVETHIRNIFGKLAVSSRVEIARAVERQQPTT